MKTSALTLALCLASGRAAAFSDYELFPADPLLSGGGGRFFTGSPVDGFGCSVCHSGGLEPQVVFQGLPAGEYVPGTIYDVEVTWSDPQRPHALALEFVTALGQAAGQLTPLEPSDASERCAGDASGEPPTHISHVAGRTILTLDDCGASRLRFRFAAPADPSLVFAASVVRSDLSQTPEGDGTFELRQVLVRQGVTRPPSTSTCSSAAARPPSAARCTPAFVALLGALALAVRRCRRRSLSGSSG